MTAAARAFDLVITMAGRGSRFVEAGYARPKPLIEVAGRPMYSWATDSIPPSLVARRLFVCLQRHLDEHDLGTDIRRRYPGPETVVVGVNDVTQGQLCTVLAAREFLAPDHPFAVYNADTVCRPQLEHTLSRTDCDGAIGVFEAEGDHWSFALLDEAGRVLETAEKRRISRWATTGLYHFARADRFLEAADHMMRRDERVNGEFYVAPVYNHLIARGAYIVADPALGVWPLGTPAELATFDPSTVPR